MVASVPFITHCFPVWTRGTLQGSRDRKLEANLPAQPGTPRACRSVAPSDRCGFAPTAPLLSAPPLPFPLTLIFGAQHFLELGRRSLQQSGSQEGFRKNLKIFLHNQPCIQGAEGQNFSQENSIFTNNRQIMVIFILGYLVGIFWEMNEICHS